MFIAQRRSGTRNTIEERRKPPSEATILPDKGLQRLLMTTPLKTHMLDIYCLLYSTKKLFRMQDLSRGSKNHAAGRTDQMSIRRFLLSSFGAISGIDNTSFSRWIR